MFDQVSELIDHKEAPGNLERAIDILDGLRRDEPDNDMVWGKLAHAYYYRGRFAREGSSEREQLFERGVDFGKRAVTLNPRALYGNYWYGSNIGMLGLCRGVMQSLKSAEPMKRALECVLRANEKFFFGGPHRGLGRLLSKLPPWPVSLGDKKKAEAHLLRAVELAPGYFLNRLFIAEHYLSSRKTRASARPHLQFLIETPVNPDHAIEDGEYKQQARALYNKHF